MLSGADLLQLTREDFTNITNFRGGGFRGLDNKSYR